MTSSERLNLLSGPAVEPVSEAEAMAHLRISGEEEIALLHGHIRTAREAVEAWTGRALISQSWRLSLDCWPEANGSAWWDGVRAGAVAGGAARFIEIPKPPLLAIQQVALFDDTDQQSIWPAANYFVDTQSAPGRLVLRNTAGAPLAGRAANAVQIDFSCGYGGSAGDIPAPLRQAVLILTAHFFENRELLRQPGEAGPAPMSVSGLLAPYRLLRV